MKALDEFSAEVRRQVDARLDAFIIPSHPATAGLFEAMRYGLLNGGKRLRPLLVFAAAESCGRHTELTLASACAIELIHAYSLIHDDLPAMDDDDLRRGNPTLHIAFDEATAILAGDALQTAAFELLAGTEAPPVTALACIRELAAAAGAAGMAGGQFIDLQVTGATPAGEDLATMHRLKTGALIRAALRMGALSVGLDAHTHHYRLLSQYGELLGLGFQIKDDLLDATGQTEIIGKRSGADASLNKPNFVSLLGVTGAQQELDNLCQQARQLAAQLEQGSSLLTELVHFVAERKL